MFRFQSGLAVLAAALTCLASPTPLEATALGPSQTDRLVQEGIELARSSGLEKRIKADFSMDKAWNNTVLFDTGHTWNQDDGSENLGLSLTCLDCQTKGTVTARLWEDITHPSVKLEFSGVEAYVFVGLNASASATFSVNLYSTQTPVGLHMPGLDVGIVFFVDLVFGITAEIDMTGGFQVKLEDDAFLEADIFGGDIKDAFFDGISSQSLPVTVTTGKATFKADLRLRAQVGAETSLDAIGIGAGAVVGIYANILELVAEIESTPTCLIETREFIDLNVGAYAHLDVVVDYKTLGPVPTISTTLLTAPTATQCWKYRDAVGGGAPVTMNLTSVGSLPSPTATSLVTTSALVNSEATLSAIQASSSVTQSSLAIPSSSLAIQTLSPVIQASSLAIPLSSATQTMSPPLVTAAPASELVRDLPAAQVTAKYPMVNSTAVAQNSAKLVANSTVGRAGELVTSTVYSTALYTITMCAAGVVNCPAAYQYEFVATRTVDAYTTVCPAGVEVTPPAAPLVVSMLEVEPVYHVMTQAVPLVPIATPIVATFVPPNPGPSMPAAAAVAPHVKAVAMAPAVAPVPAPASAPVLALAVAPVLAPAIPEAMAPAVQPNAGVAGRYNATSALPSVTVLTPGLSTGVNRPVAYSAKPVAQPVTAAAAGAGVGLLRIVLAGAVGVVVLTL